MKNPSLVVTVKVVGIFVVGFLVVGFDLLLVVVGLEVVGLFGLVVGLGVVGLFGLVVGGIELWIIGLLVVGLNLFVAVFWKFWCEHLHKGLYCMYTLSLSLFSFLGLDILLKVPLLSPITPKLQGYLPQNSIDDM